MLPGFLQSECRAKPLCVGRLAAEVFVVVSIGAIVALAGNQLKESGKRFDITRNYFKITLPAPVPANPSQADDSKPNDDGTNEVATNDTAATGTGKKNLTGDDFFQKIEHAATMEAFQSAAYEVGQCIFIDARNDEAYAEKHIPGAYQLDHYYVDRYLDEVLPACANATQIIVYCNGGKCEDSKLATMDLIERGVAAEKLFVYIGGVVAWSKDGLPFERGERLSGDTVYGDEQ